MWEADRSSVNEWHPTQKPVALAMRAIANHTDHGACVLDPFGGSGSTLIAAEQTGRLARLTEIDPLYCDVICRRWQLHSGVLAVRERTGAAHDFTS